MAKLRQNIGPNRKALESANLAYVNKVVESIISHGLVSRDFW